MIKSLGPGLDSLDFLRIALGSQHTFIVVQNSNLSKPLVIPWPILLQQIQAQLNISSTSTIDVRDEGTIIDATAQFLNFVGAGVTVTQNGNGVDITIPGGGGTTPSLQQVVDSGNAISNFLPSGNASIQSTNFLSNRTLYLNNDSNPTIKIEDNLNSSHYTIIDIDTINLNGTSYNWSTIVSGTTPDLQQVTNVGATTTNTIVVGNIANINSQILPTNVGTEDATTGTQAFLDYTGFLGLNNGTVQSNLLNTGVTNAGVQLTFPNKPTGTYTIATTADLTTTDIVSPFLLMGG